MDKEFQKLEAVKRMEKLNFSNDIIEKMKKNDICKSLMGFCFRLNEEEIEMVRDWEEKTGNFVYHLTYDEYDFGNCYTFLYVSEYQEEWESDRFEMNSNRICAYVKNLTVSEFSEIGFVLIIPIFEGILRIG